MSYQVLARKWRPSSFDEMMGQQHVLRALVNALENDRLHHAYLFTGTRGVGKTTVARILAKCLNCEQGVTATPCGECGSCVEIAEGRCVDLLEVDAASRTKVDDTRELLDNVQYAPTRARYKIYLIDEVHMLSTHSFNALLKTLEEPPPHAKFLLATTDPQKLPATILSRCLQFNLKNMLPSQIIERLEFILGEESIGFDLESLRLLAHAAEGSMRDALSLTDQAVAFSGGELREDDVRAMLGTVDRGRVVKLAETVLTADAPGALDAVAAIAEHAPDYAATLGELASILHQVTLAQMVPERVDSDAPDAHKIAALADTSSADEVQLCYQMAVKGRAELALASDPRIGLEMVLLRMIAFRPGVVISPEEAAAPPKKPEPPAQPVVPVTSLTHSRAPTAAAAATPSATSVTAINIATEPPVTAPAIETTVEPSARTAAPSAKIAANEPEAVALAPEEWPTVYEQLGLSGLIGSVMLHTELGGGGGDVLEFVLDESNSTLYNERQQAQLQQALVQFLERPVSVSVQTGTVGKLTPAAHRAAVAAQRLQAAETALAGDARLQALISTFDAEIIPGSIRAPQLEQVVHEDH
jgi:DNA polymerase-3 subunit gamma/tau